MARDPQGRFLGMPYNWKRPTHLDLRRGVWDHDDDRIFPPKSFGWGYGLNLAALRRRLSGR
jgi:hypothetical protein